MNGSRDNKSAMKGAGLAPAAGLTHSSSSASIDTPFISCSSRYARQLLMSSAAAEESKSMCDLDPFRRYSIRSSGAILRLFFLVDRSHFRLPDWAIRFRVASARPSTCATWRIENDVPAPDDEASSGLKGWRCRSADTSSQTPTMRIGLPRRSRNTRPLDRIQWMLPSG